MTVQAFLLNARDFMLRHRTDYETVYHDFEWPVLDAFNWALDCFDPMTRGNGQPALWIVDAATGTGGLYSFAQMSERSSRIANWLRLTGVVRDDRILLVRPNRVELWDAIFAAVRLGAIMLPATTQLSLDDGVRDRVQIGGTKYVIVDENGTTKFKQPGLGLAQKIVVGAARTGWLAMNDGYAVSAGSSRTLSSVRTIRCCCTSRRARRRNRSSSSIRAAPIRSVICRRRAESACNQATVRWNISSSRWEKHAWSFFAPSWNDAQAYVLAFNHARFEPKVVLDDALVKYQVTTLRAPLIVWRVLVRQPLASFDVKLREIVDADEPLNPEIIERVKRTWGIAIRDGYGQTETTSLIGNSLAQPVVAGSMGRSLPGYRIALLDPDGMPVTEGEVAPPISPDVTCPVGLRSGYANNPDVTAYAMRDDDGHYVYIGRADDVFKSSAYRLSPFEFESVLIEHPAITEAVAVPSSDPVRSSLPKTFITLRQGSRKAPRSRWKSSVSPAVQAYPPPVVRGIAEDDLGENLARRAAPPRD